MKKYLFPTISALMLGVFITITAFVTGDEKKPSKPIETSLLNPAIKPGDDFFAYVNSKWIQENPIPASESRWGSFNILQENSKKMVREIMQDNAKTNNAKGSVAQKVGDFWFTGMDSASIEKQGIKPLKSYFDMVDAIQNKDDVLKATAQLQKTGATPFFGIYVDADLKNSSMNTLTLYQSGLGMPDRDYYLLADANSEEIRNAYKEYIKKLFSLMGNSATVAGNAATTVMRIETDLANASMTLVEQRDPYATYNKMTFTELTSKTSSINWKLYMTEMGFPPMNDLVVAQPKFLEKVNSMMNEVSIEDWKTYLKFHCISNASNLISSDFEKAHFEFFDKTLTGVEEMQPRWKRISDLANFCLGEALGQEYVKRAFSPEAKAKMVTLVSNLRTAFAIRIDNLDWMSAETKAKAKKKLSTILVKVGYPDKWKDYSSLQIDKGPFVLNVFRCVEFESNRMIAKTGKPVDRTEWLMPPQTVNAYYNPTNNEIVFPAAILQPPFFDPNADNAVNYGGIGAVIGHEITHGFDDQGRQFDAEGNLTEWWTEEDGKKFEEKAARVSQFYSRYNPIDTMHINGDLTNGENIADQGGLAIAFTAFQLEQKRNPQPAMIDGFTPEQRFFINYGQIWRGHLRDDALRLRLRTDYHSPGKYRVLGILSNTPDWYQAFNVTPTDKMYVKPESQTRIW